MLLQSINDISVCLRRCIIAVWCVICDTLWRPDGIGTVLHEEWDSFLEVKDRLRRLVENQLTNFRSSLLHAEACFSFSVPNVNSTRTAIIISHCTYHRHQPRYITVSVIIIVMLCNVPCSERHLLSTEYWTSRWTALQFVTQNVLERKVKKQGAMKLMITVKYFPAAFVSSHIRMLYWLLSQLVTEYYCFGWLKWFKNTFIS